MDQRRMCPNCRAFITTRDKVCPYCNERVGPRAVERRDPGAILGGFIPHARFVTMIILTINVGLYLATVVFSQRKRRQGGLFDVDGQTLLAFGAKLRDAILNYGQWWRLVTAGFLHGGLLHIGMNSWVLFDLGAQVEDVYGASRLIVVYFMATVFGFLLSTFWTAALSVGASAGIMGLIGAMIALGVRNRHTCGGRGDPRHVRPVGGLHLDFRLAARIAYRQRGAHRRIGSGIRGRLSGRHAARRDGLERTDMEGGGCRLAC